MLKILAILFGLVFIICGILGFFPDYVREGKLFDLFTANTTHSIIRIGVGVIAILCGFSSSGASKAFFIIAGLAYAAFAALGFYYGEGQLFNLITVTKTDNWLHTGIAAVSLYFGFFLQNK